MSPFHLIPESTIQYMDTKIILPVTGLYVIILCVCIVHIVVVQCITWHQGWICHFNRTIVAIVTITLHFRGHSMVRVICIWIPGTSFSPYSTGNSHITFGVVHWTCWLKVTISACTSRFYKIYQHWLRQLKTTLVKTVKNNIS
jgi:ABC-type xylose transport system permease subunit